MTPQVEPAGDAAEAPPAPRLAPAAQPAKAPRPAKASGAGRTTPPVKAPAGKKPAPAAAAKPAPAGKKPAPAAGAKPATPRKAPAADPAAARSHGNKHNRYKPREIGLAGGGKLTLHPDGSISLVDGAGASSGAWAPGDPDWASHAIRFGLQPQAETVAPHGRRAPDPRPLVG